MSTIALTRARLARWLVVALAMAACDAPTGPIAATAPVATKRAPTPAGPAEPTGGAAFASIDAGYFYTCGLARDGAAYCWGDNRYGQLGDGTLAPRATPTAVAGGLAFTSVSAGVFQTCGVATDRRAYCWGGAYGSTPARVDGGDGFVAITVGFQHTCALTAAGAAHCWGDNWLGALGTGDLLPRSAPAPVAGGLAFTSLSAGWDFTCAVATDGAGYCWGRSDVLGSTAGAACEYSDYDGVIACHPAPSRIEGGHTFSQIGTGERFACALTRAGSALCWGRYPADAQSDTPVAIPGGLSFTSLGVDASRACGVAAGGSVVCWGWLPIQDSFSNAPRAVEGGTTFSAVSVGWYHSCGVASSGVGYCWGKNDIGELGDGSSVSSASPVKVAGQR